MQIYCRQCGAAIKAENIHLETMMAKCNQCDAVFSFADMYEGVSGKGKAEQGDVLQDIPMPSGVTMYDNGSALSIERKWFSPLVFFIAFFAVIWNGMIYAIFVPAFGRVGGIPTLFLLPFILVGLGLILYVVATFVNTTYIEVDSQTLNISHKPIPFPARTVDVANIVQLYTKRRIHRGKNGTTTSYGLYVITADGKNQRLIGSLSDPKQALYMEQEIERFLGIENREVRGEMR